MANADTLRDLESLQSSTAAGNIGIDQVGRAFERLTSMLTGVTKAEDGVLRDLVNDIERIRFTGRSESQMSAVAAVVRTARPIFDRISARSPSDASGS
jgi:hypothetical protein